MSQSNNNNSPWLDALADKARQAQQPVDEQLWQRIEPQLPAPRGRRPAWLWWSAAAATAAAILALVITTRPVNIDKVGGEVTAQATPAATTPSPSQQTHAQTLLPSQGTPTQSPLPSQETSTQSPLPSQETSTQSPFPSQETSTQSPLPSQETSTQSPLPSQGTPTQPPLPSQGRGRGGVESPSLPQETERNIARIAATTATQQHNNSQFSIHNSQLKNSNSQFSIHNSQLKNNMISLYGSGNLLAQNSIHAMQRPVLMSMGNGRFMEAEASTRYHYKHRIPLNVGIMFNKSLPYNLTAGIGVNYARYSSEVSADLERFDQTVQFIGIPVALQWHFWHYRRLSAYIGAETMAERCIAVDRGDEQVDVPRRIQWSVHGMAGLQLDVTDHLGLFVEPKVSHYATEFTLPTARNEHPLTFNLKMGASINF